MTKSKKPKVVSVFVPVFNGEQYLAETIEAILHQELPKEHALELIIIDSGSADDSVGIIQRHYSDRVRLYQIPNSEFGHGKTRQKAAEIASGEFILFLSQDATPTNYRWLISMIEPFYLSERVGCVYGRQVPRPNAPATIKREVSGVFGGLSHGNDLLISRARSLVDSAAFPVDTFFSDVNSAVRRDLLTHNVPFRDLPYAEDQALAEDMQTAGYLKAYAPEGAVWHSNDYTFSEYFHRKFDEYIGLQESVGLKLKPSVRSLVLGWIRPTLLDWMFVMRDRQYSLYSKIVWLLEAPLYNLGERAGRFQALRHIDNQSFRQKTSLEARRARKHKGRTAT